MKTRNALLSCAALFIATMSANAASITYFAEGNPNITGSITFDTTGFGSGSSDSEPNTSITGLSLTVFGSLFTFADIVTAADTFFNDTVNPPVIINGGGLLADNGSFEIAFYPDGYNGVNTTGNASIAFATEGTPCGGTTCGNFYAVDLSTTAVPEPTTGALFATSLAAAAILMRKKLA
jgi:hypothetical protein